MSDDTKALLVLGGLGLVAVVGIMLLTRSPGAQGMAAYENAEEWEIERDGPDGPIIRITVHRQAQAL